jgi:hypothetical protein
MRAATMTTGYEHLAWTTGLRSDAVAEDFNARYTTLRRFNMLGRLLSYGLLISGVVFAFCGPFSTFLFKRPFSIVWDSLFFYWAVTFIGRLLIEERGCVMLTTLSDHRHLERLNYNNKDVEQFVDRIMVCKRMLLYHFWIFAVAVVGFTQWNRADGWYTHTGRQWIAVLVSVVTAHLIGSSWVCMRRFNIRTHTRFRDYIGDYDEGAGDLNLADYPSHWT